MDYVYYTTIFIKNIAKNSLFQIVNMIMCKYGIKGRKIPNKGGEVCEVKADK